MSKCKITTLSPIHIGSGEQFEENYNMLQKDGLVYIYDEFKISEFFLENNLGIPSSLGEMQQKMKQYRDKIIQANIHIRKLQTSLLVNKPLFEMVSTQGNPIITGSSIKGALRTAILDSLKNSPEKSQKIANSLRNKKIDKSRFENKRGKNIEAFDKDFANIFKYLKVSDSIGELETKVYKTINIKKNREHQKHRAHKVKELENFVESLKPNQTFEISIDDCSDETIFENLGSMCNGFYIPKIKEELGYYFKVSSGISEKIKSLNNRVFIINVGKFGGGEHKSINGLRWIKMVKDGDKSKTTARTFATESSVKDETYFEKSLLPFGWLLCEVVGGDK